MSTRVDAAIVAVTVFPGQARITRRATVTLAEGIHQVVVGGLPQRLRADSVRVSGRGPATVLGVDVAAEHHPRAPDGAIEELERRRRELLDRIEELSDQDTVQIARTELIEALARRSGAAFAKALAGSATEPARVVEVGDALADQLGAVLARRRELTGRRHELEEELDEVGRRMGERTVQRAPDRTAVTVELELTGTPAEVELEVSYLVDGAGWESRYDIRLRADKLAVTWFGLVSQNTGEDWPECDLRLSTARPASAVTVPELDPWYLQRWALYPAAGGAVDAVAGSLGFAAPAPAPAAMAPGGRMPATRAGAEVAVSTATVEHGVAAATYRPARPVAVPSDGTAHRTTVTTAELPTSLDHVTVPLRGPEVYLRATATNTSEHTMRPGPAAVFHDTEFVGSTDLEVWAPGEEVELTLGVDDRVRVERELIRRTAGKAALGGTRRHEARYRITIGNYGPRQANLTVIDQIPVSRDDAIVVREVQVAPKPAEQTDLGEITWRLRLDPNQTETLTMGFRVDVAKGVQLAGWRDA